MADSSQMTQSINTAQSNPIELLKSLIDVFQSSQQQQQQADSLNKQDQTQAVQNAYQKGVNKALSEHGYKHGSDAIAAGVDPNEIANHDTMQPVMNINPNNNQSDPSQLLGAIVAAHLANQPQQNNNIGQQALDIVKPSTSFFGKLMDNLGNSGIIHAQQLANLASAQKIAAGQPAEVGLPQAEQQAIQQKMAGQEPLQLSDIATIKANVNKLNLDSLNMSSQRLDADMKTRQDAIEASQKTINLMGKLGGMFSGTGTTITPVMKQLQKEIENIKKVKAKVDSQIANFNPPSPLSDKSSKFTEGATYKDAQGNTAVYKNGKFQ